MEEKDVLIQEAEKLEKKMSKLVDNKIDPLLEKLAKMGEVTPEMATELKSYGAKFEALQKQADDLDLKLQKANVPNQGAPIYDQVMHAVKGMDWVKDWKSFKRGGTLDLKGIDMMNTKVGTVTF